MFLFSVYAFKNFVSFFHDCFFVIATSLFIKKLSSISHVIVFSDMLERVDSCYFLIEKCEAAVKEKA